MENVQSEDTTAHHTLKDWMDVLVQHSTCQAALTSLSLVLRLSLDQQVAPCIRHWRFGTLRAHLDALYHNLGSHDHARLADCPFAGAPY
jgi:hypothetical protein